MRKLFDEYKKIICVYFYVRYLDAVFNKVSSIRKKTVFRVDRPFHLGIIRNSPENDEYVSNNEEKSRYPEIKLEIFTAHIINP